MKKTSGWSRFLRKFRDILIAGLVVTVPIGATIWIFAWLFTQVDQLLRPWVAKIIGHEIIGVGFAAIFILVLVVGAITMNVIGKRMVRWGETLLSKIPISRTVYESIRQVIQSFSENEKSGFLDVVMVEYPRKGIHTIGFVTNEHIDEKGKKLINVFIPTAPNPMTGFIQIVDESEILRTNITVEEALKMVVSAGRMSPKEVGDKMVRAKKDAEQTRIKDE